MLCAFYLFVLSICIYIVFKSNLNKWCGFYGLFMRVSDFTERARVCVLSSETAPYFCYFGHNFAVASIEANTENLARSNSKTENDTFIQVRRIKKQIKLTPYYYDRFFQLAFYLHKLLTEQCDFMKKAKNARKISL